MVSVRCTWRNSKTPSKTTPCPECKTTLMRPRLFWWGHCSKWIHITHISLCIAYIFNLNYPPAQYNWGSARKRWKAWRLGRQEWGPVHAVQGFLQDSEENKFLLWNKLGLNLLVTGACIHFTGRFVPNALNVPGIFLYTWKITVNGWFLGWKLEDLC